MYITNLLLLCGKCISRSTDIYFDKFINSLFLHSSINSLLIILINFVGLLQFQQENCNSLNNSTLSPEGVTQLKWIISNFMY